MIIKLDKSDIDLIVFKYIAEQLKINIEWDNMIWYFNGDNPSITVTSEIV
jgi:hypothetical protein